MKETVYTLAAWRVQDGRQQAFISARKELAEAFNALSDPPGKGVLTQSTSDPTLFYSFVPWKSMEAVDAMRNDPHAREGIKRLEGLCTEATPERFTLSPNRPSSAHRQADSNTMKRQSSLRTRRSTRRANYLQWAARVKSVVRRATGPRSAFLCTSVDTSSLPA